MIGKSFGKYRIVDELGRGRLGTVYRAVDDSAGREVAIRFLRPELHDEEALKRFMADAMVLGRLNRHEHATVYGVKKADPDLLILMELIKGESLELLVSRPGLLPPERSAYLVSQVLDALSYAHNAGVVHGNIKPSNLVLTDTRYIKIMEFGFSNLLEAERRSGRHVQESEPYLAPEQLRLEGVDARTDLYACGCVLYRMLTERLPFEASNASDLMHKQLHELPTPASTYLPDLPEWCDRVLTKALAKSPADRFQTAEEFRTVLLPPPDSSSEVRTDTFAAIPLPGARAVVSSAPSPVTTSASTTASPPAAAAATQPVTPPAPHPPEAAPLQRTRVMTAAVILIAIVVAIVAYNFGAGITRTQAPVASEPAVASAPTAAPPPSPSPTDAAPQTAEAAPPVTPPDATSPIPTPDKQAPVPKVAAPSSSRAVPVVPPSSAETRSSAAVPPSAAPAPAFPQMVFDADAVVADRGKFRERDARVTLADGKISIAEKDTVIAALAFDALSGISYSTSRHPQWTSPNGPADLLQVEGGAFGIRRSGRNWIALRTRDAVQIIRVKDDDISRVLAALEARTGRTVDRVAEQKD
jgi:serine/threonine protein kinase